MQIVTKQIPLAMNINNKSQQLKAIKAKVANLDKTYSDLGKITILLGSSKYHRQFNAAHIMVYVLFPMRLGYYKIYYQGIKPIGYVAWSFLSDEIQTKYQTGDYMLEPKDYSSGDNIWLTDFVTPYDEQRGDKKDRNLLIEDLTKNIFKGKELRIIVRNQDGSVKRITKNFFKGN
jgi:cytolysin-activating lysine-acyltransferase